MLPSMSFITLEENFNSRHAKTLRNLLQKCKIDTPKCVIFTHSTNETLAIRDMIYEVGSVTSAVTRLGSDPDKV